MATEEEYKRVTTTEEPTTPTISERREYRTTVMERLIYLVGGILLTLLALRFLLSLLGANRGNGFADFIYDTSHPFVAPFFGLFNYDETFGQSRFEYETLIAIIIYAVAMAIIARLVTISSHRADR